MSKNDEMNVVELSVATATKARVFNVETKEEISLSWDDSSLEKLSSQIRSQPLSDNQIIFFCSYYKVHRFIRNFDRNEYFIYLEHLVGYDPIKEFKNIK